ncbi:hypothetical protein SAMD00019534_020880 [Acytostelium subglobosum LB1]|uniref:hypothetical protein n=1 Tax=Acytostelium subglobosum LB1 TaxID=1410327 RepID=UPI0006449E1B|nr:hypothetical protein SAMD00019534_020880 [Acytostelium subglobosum LB1]GAM18913.1 hypothetical protein SAMD00019534_020880 [Acytostelium subglobosum LB1]|eukprot:XP_012758133.1 hypothetical protein SAMD00019534_020880 [Acytostelium subglobosum LB1]
MEQYLNSTGLIQFASYIQQQRDEDVENTKLITSWFTGTFDNKHTGDNEQSLYIYTVPKLGDGGTCSLKHETETYNLESTIGTRTSTKSNILSRLYSITLNAQQLTKVDWIGIYKVYQVNGENALVKLAYQGEISRPIFPLNDYWETISNNSFVGIHGKGRIIQTLEGYDGPYYNCSDKVKSELCIPIFDRNDNTKVIGIIDAESWREKHFDASSILALARLCLELPQLLQDEALSL